MRILVVVILVIFGFAAVALVFLARTDVLHAYKVPTKAMEPTLSPGDNFYMDGLSYRFRKPRRGEIVVFRIAGILGIPEPEPLQSSPIFMKRVIGLPGDKLEIHEERLLVNGREDPALASLEIAYGPQYLTEDGATVEVPTDSYFVVGDNSRNSFDSRHWGFVPATNIKGRAFFRYWPLSRIGFL